MTRPWSMLATVALLGSLCALSWRAQAEPDDWNKAYRRSQTVMVVGAVTPVVATTAGSLAIAGVLARRPRGGNALETCADACNGMLVATALVAATLSVLPAGPMLVAGSSLRARRAVVELGGSAPAWPGYAAWGAAGATVGWMVVALAGSEKEGVTPAALGAAGLFLIASYGLGAAQWAINGERKRDLEDRGARLPPQEITMPLFRIAGRF